MESVKKISRREFMDRMVKMGTAGLVTLFGTSLWNCGTGKSENWQIGCYTRPWAEYDYRVAFDAIAEAGYRYLGLMTTQSDTRLVISASTAPEQAQKVGDEAKRRGLDILSVYGGDIPVAESLQAGIEALKRLIDNCTACDGKNLLMGGTGTAALFEVYYQAIAACCDYAAERGIGISLKPHGGLNATGLQCRKIIEMVGHKNFRIWYDPGNIFYYSDGGLDPVADVSSVAGLVVGMSVKDYLPPKDVNITPGTGQVDFPKVLAGLQQGGFTAGPLIVECLQPGDLKQTLEQAQKARFFLEELTGQTAVAVNKKVRSWPA